MMMKIFTKRLTAVGLWLMFSFCAIAQNQMLIELTDGTTENYPVSEIRSIKFGDTTMILNLLNNSAVTYAIADIGKYYFNSINSTDNLSSLLADPLTIYPNPASDQIDIAYVSPKDEHITIRLIDCAGRCVATPFSGKHFGHQVYKQPLNLAAGLYFCRITSESQTLTQPFTVH